MPKYANLVLFVRKNDTKMIWMIWNENKHFFAQFIDENTLLFPMYGNKSPKEAVVHFYTDLHCRYLVICHPMKAQYISTPGRAKKIIAVVWMAAIGLSALPAYFVTGVCTYFLYNCFMVQSDLRFT